jgi:catechol 2,3-dioxygenase-like lactoylglutathione lyase family enzyme
MQRRTDLYAAYISSCERGRTPGEASAAAGLFVKGPPGRYSPTTLAWLADSEIERTRMSENDIGIDYANLPAPSEGLLVTLFITVRTIARSRAFYTEVLGGTVVLAENPCIVKLANSWIIMNPGGPPTPDKPDVTVVNYEPGDTTSIFLNLRVADIDACYRQWSDRGATFLTPPMDRGAEIRCYMRDPDGYLIEVGQATGVLSGQLAARRPEDIPG